MLFIGGMYTYTCDRLNNVYKVQSLDSLGEIEVCSMQNLVEVGSWIKRYRCIGGTSLTSPTMSRVVVTSG